ncbi:Xan family putative trans-acting RiPP leader peptide [Archangium violaceum]|uniref:Xan family putative trans-acting RiPP leader peptide n=1 Tax=Archangium violaceum TaxID=83451 RepID=UPI000B1AC12A|nr:Xan family putative trans-acting RiPP leader peptide [Archangium violaceum]
MAAEETTSAHHVDSSVESTPVQAAASASAPEKLDELEEINFLLEEIESKIAPLALA